MVVNVLFFVIIWMAMEILIALAFTDNHWHWSTASTPFRHGIGEGLVQSTVRVMHIVSEAFMTHFMRFKWLFMLVKLRWRRNRTRGVAVAKHRILRDRTQ